MERIPIIAVSLIVVLVACGSSTTPIPTLAPESRGATNIAPANTAVRNTATPIPTETLVPTNTAAAPTPTLTFTPLPTATQTKVILPWACQGDGVGNAMLDIINNSGKDSVAVISSSICYKEIQLGDGDTVHVTAPISNYYYYGYIGTDIAFGGSVFLSDSIHTWVLTLNPDSAIMSTP
jgi:hypothetical protein